jgi:hypothetical protein
VALTAAQVTAGCRPLIYAADSPALTALISAQDDLRISALDCPQRRLYICTSDQP